MMWGKAVRTLVIGGMVFGLSEPFLTASMGADIAAVPIQRLSTDPYSNPAAQHATEVEPDTFSFGSAIVSAFQVGRFFEGGSTNIGFATSQNGGQSWVSGILPGITTIEGGTFDRASDPSVAFDAAHGVWIIATLALLNTPDVHGEAVVVSRSTNGGLSWSNPVLVNRGGDSDKNWIVCDNFSGSPFFGHCYLEWSEGGQITFSTSLDGGLTWGAELRTADAAFGTGGQPLVRPNGTVVVPFTSLGLSQLRVVRSLNGGASWRNSFSVASIQRHQVAGGLRAPALPSAEVDGAGRIFVAWSDCRFESGCSANDIVLISSSDGLNWSSVRRIPIHSIGSGFDHFIPGLGVDRTTSGGSARLGLTYYYYPNANCTASTCALRIGFVGSSTGSATWTPHLQLVDTMRLSWLPSTNQGRMVGDYISTSFSGGLARPAFAVAFLPSGGLFNQGIFAPVSGLSTLSAQSNSSDGEEIFKETVFGDEGEDKVGFLEHGEFSDIEWNSEDQVSFY